MSNSNNSGKRKREEVFSEDSDIGEEEQEQEEDDLVGIESDNEEEEFEVQSNFSIFRRNSLDFDEENEKSSLNTLRTFIPIRDKCIIVIK